MRALDRICAVIFDLDGVLVSTDECHYLAWKGLADRLGIPFSRSDNTRLRGVSRMESLDIILSLGSARAWTKEERCELADEKNEAYRALLGTLSPDSVAPSVRDVLAELKRRGYLLAVGSSSKNAMTIMDRCDLTGAFDAIVDGNKIAHSKPDGEVFLRAAVALSTDPHRCLVVEDASAGIDAARAAGMVAAGIGDAARDCDVALADLTDLLDLLDAPLVYNPAHAALLRDLAKEQTIDGLSVKVCPIPDLDCSACLDPRALVHERRMQRDMAAIDPHAPAPTIAELRQTMGGPNQDLTTEEVWSSRLHVETPSGPIEVRRYRPRRARGELPALIYVHGGAFFGGTPDTVENPCRLISELGPCVVFNVDYGLAPEHSFPEAAEQVYAVLAHVHEHAHELGVDCDRIAVGGDSAGGNHACACVHLDRDRHTGYAAGNVLLYAKLTFTNHLLPGYARDEGVFEICEDQRDLLPGLLHIGSDESNAQDAAVYLGSGGDLSDPILSPAFGAKEGLPPTLIVLAEYDGLRLEGEFYARSLVDAGVCVRVVRYQGVGHGFFDLLGELPQAAAAAEEIAEFVRDLPVRTKVA